MEALPIPFDIPNVLEAKKAFALQLLKHESNPFKAGMEAFKDGDTSKALWVARHWVLDDEVLLQKELIIQEKGEATFLPSKAEVSKKIFSLLNENGLEVKETLEILKTYAQIMDFMPKNNQTNIQVNNNEQKVMIVPHFGSDDDWEEAVKKQQQQLREPNEIKVKE